MATRPPRPLRPHLNHWRPPSRSRAAALTQPCGPPAYQRAIDPRSTTFANPAAFSDFAADALRMPLAQ